MRKTPLRPGPLGALFLLCALLSGCASVGPAGSGWMTSDQALRSNPSLPPNMYPQADYNHQYYRPGAGAGQVPARVR